MALEIVQEPEREFDGRIGGRYGPGPSAAAETSARNRSQSIAAAFAASVRMMRVSSSRYDATAAGPEGPKDLKAGWWGR